MSRLVFSLMDLVSSDMVFACIAVCTTNEEGWEDTHLKCNVPRDGDGADYAFTRSERFIVKQA
jgi:hypothetical protein